MATLKIATEDEAYLIGGQGTPTEKKTLVYSKVGEFGCVIKDSPHFNYAYNQLVALDDLKVGRTLRYLRIVDINTEIPVSRNDIEDQQFNYAISNVYFKVVAIYDNNYMEFVPYSDLNITVSNLIADNHYPGNDAVLGDFVSNYDNDEYRIKVNKSTYSKLSNITINVSYGGKMDTWEAPYSDGRIKLTDPFNVTYNPLTYCQVSANQYQGAYVLNITTNNASMKIKLPNSRPEVTKVIGGYNILYNYQGDDSYSSSKRAQQYQEISSSASNVLNFTSIEPTWDTSQTIVSNSSVTTQNPVCGVTLEPAWKSYTNTSITYYEPRYSKDENL